MNKDLFADLLDRPIAFHRVLADVTGTITGALFLSQALYWQHRCPANRDGWWWKVADDWYKETRLTTKEQARARKRLKSLGILEETKKGIPCRLWYRVDYEKLLVAIQNSESRQGRKKVDQVCRDSAGKFAKKRCASSAVNELTNTEITLKAKQRIKAKPAESRDTSRGLSFCMQFGIEWPENLVTFLNEHRAVAIAMKYGLDSTGIRLVIAEYSAQSMRGFKKDPVAAWVWLCTAQSLNQLNLSKEGEESLPPWS